MFCGICSYHAHASSSKGSSCARIRKEHNQGIGGCCSIPPKRSVCYISTSTHLESNLCAPLLLSTGTYVLHLERPNETITASNPTSLAAHTIAFDTQNGDNVTSLHPLHNLNCFFTISRRLANVVTLKIPYASSRNR